MPKSLNDSGTSAPLCEIVALRKELAWAEGVLREKAKSEAVRLAEAEGLAWRQAQADCFQLDRMRARAKARLQAIKAGGPENFTREGELAEMVLQDARMADASYTVISFARLRDRFRYLHGGADREVVLREAVKYGGVFTERDYFQEILR